MHRELADLRYTVACSAAAEPKKIKYEWFTHRRTKKESNNVLLWIKSRRKIMESFNRDI